MKFKGLGVALITPFTSDNKIDLPALEKITDHLIENKADFIVLLGTTAETVNLSEDEKKVIIQTVRQVNNNRIPLIAGIGGYSTDHVISEIMDFDTEGISGILSVCPYYNKPNQEGIYHHYEAISAISPLPLIMYNVPSRTSVNMNAETTLRLARDFSNIVAIKEASGNFSQIMTIIKEKPENFTVISGDDLITLPLMSIGGEGVISVIGNAFPVEFSAMVHAALSNDYIKAREFHYELQEFIELIFSEGSPSGIKGLMSLMGFCNKKVRLPLWELSENVMNKLSILLKEREK